jgi:hypothetical protein
MSPLIVSLMCQRYEGCILGILTQFKSTITQSIRTAQLIGVGVIIISILNDTTVGRGANDLSNDTPLTLTDEESKFLHTLTILSYEQNSYNVIYA